MQSPSSEGGSPVERRARPRSGRVRGAALALCVLVPWVEAQGDRPCFADPASQRMQVECGTWVGDLPLGGFRNTPARSLADFTGHFVVVHYFAEGQHPQRVERRRELARANAGSNVVVLGITEGTPEEAAARAAALGIDWPYAAFRDRRALAEVFTVWMLSTSGGDALIDPLGRIASRENEAHLRSIGRSDAPPTPVWAFPASGERLRAELRRGRLDRAWNAAEELPEDDPCRAAITAILGEEVAFLDRLSAASDFLGAHERAVWLERDLGRSSRWGRAAAERREAIETDARSGGLLAAQRRIQELDFEWNPHSIVLRARGIDHLCPRARRPFERILSECDAIVEEYPGTLAAERALSFRAGFDHQHRACVGLAK